MLSDDVVSEIKTTALELFEEFKPWGFSQQQLLNYHTTDTIRLILKHNNIELHKRNFRVESFCGLLFINDELGTSIAVNENHIPTRQLFTTAHELGHFYLHRNLQSQFLDQGMHEEVYSPIGLIMEQEANLFASELLIPLEVLEAMLLKKYNYFKIAKIIGVSKAALKWRIHRYLREKYFIDYKFVNMLVEEYKFKSINQQTSESLIFDITDDNYVLYEIYEALCGRDSFIHLHREKPKVGIFI